MSFVALLQLRPVLSKLLSRRWRSPEAYEGRSDADGPEPTFNKTLSDFSKEYGLDIQEILNGFIDNNVSASADMTIKQIARQNDMAPTDIYTLLRRITEK